MLTFEPRENGFYTIYRETDRPKIGGGFISNDIATIYKNKLHPYEGESFSAEELLKIAPYVDKRFEYESKRLRHRSRRFHTN